MFEPVSPDEVLLKKVNEAIEKYYAEASFGVEKLAREIGISRAHLYRRLHSLTGKAANQMIREYRLEKASELLQTQAGTVSEIAYQLGFSSPSYFNTCFSEYYGYPPGKVKGSTPSGISKRFFLSRKAMHISLATGFMAIVALLFFMLMSPGRGRITGKARGTNVYIAVLPFISLSTDAADQYLADAMTDEIILHLSYNQDLRVMPRISVEQYRSKERNIKQIFRELDVEYILDGSFQKQGDQVKIIVYLVQARTNRMEWKNKYSGNWTDIFTIQSQIAQLIARELDIEISPEAKQNMEKIPTTSPDATNFYWRGNYELNKYNAKDGEAIERAEHLFHEAIRMDSTYARAYVGLARIYWTKHYWDTFLSEDFADSAFILANKALSFDRQLAEAYVIRGSYYRKISNEEQASKEYNKAISLNPSSAEAYFAKGQLYLHVDHVKSLENLYKAALLERGEHMPEIYRRIALNYGHAGFKEISLNYIKHALKLDGDSAVYYDAVSEIEHCFGDFDKAIELEIKSNAFDSTGWWKSYFLGMNYSFLDNFEESFEWLKRYEEGQFKSGSAISWGTFWGMFRLAHAYWINGYYEEANYYIAEGLELYNKMLELDRHFVADLVSFYYLAAVYAFRGNSEKAYEYLAQVNDRQLMPQWMVPCIKYDPLFDSLRGETQFQQIVRDVEAKCQAEQERVRQWMEENKML